MIQSRLNYYDINLVMKLNACYNQSSPRRNLALTLKADLAQVTTVHTADLKQLHLQTEEKQVKPQARK